MHPTIIVLAFAIPFVALAFGYVFLRRHYRTATTGMTQAAMSQGYKNALVCLSGMLVALFLTAVVIRIVFGWVWTESIKLAFGVFYLVILLSFFVSWIRSLRQKRSLVLDCGSHPAKGTFLFQAAIWSLFTLGMVAAICVSFFSESEN